jgi:response regulator of citrate/malate metabolism
MEQVTRKSSSSLTPSPRVLIIDDDPSTRPLWAHIIAQASEGAQVTWASSEIEAEEVLREAQRENAPFELVITDIFLSAPRTGLELLKRYETLERSRVIVTSGVGYEKFLRQLGQCKIEQRPLFLQKPIDPEAGTKAVAFELTLTRH